MHIASKAQKIIVAIDSFKGCLTSKEANQAAADGIRSILSERLREGVPAEMAEIVQVPVSDGGEGFLDAFHSAIGGEQIEVTVRDPLMRPISAKYLLRDELAVIEIAQASGLTLLTNEERNPMVATSYGTGQLVADAVRKGAKHIIVGLGGSATSDAGIGMLRALKDTFTKNGTWDDIEALKQVRFTIASDVKNPLYGENGAAHVFAPQKFAIQREESELVQTSEREQTRPKVKGATPDMIQQLDERARKFAEVSAKHFGYDRSEAAGAGAAGGLGYAFLQYLNAECKPGIELLLDTINFSEIIKDADLVITGEGSADRQTLMGKLPMGILQQSGDVPVCLIAGRISDKEYLLKAGFAHVECINPEGIPLEEAMRKEVATRNITDTVRQLLKMQNK
ncbi:MAG: glycerate kinase [Prevotella sp.]|nr:glycerate kinase [Prevotella sp.]